MSETIKLTLQGKEYTVSREELELCFDYLTVKSNDLGLITPDTDSAALVKRRVNRRTEVAMSWLQVLQVELQKNCQRFEDYTLPSDYGNVIKDTSIAIREYSLAAYSTYGKRRYAQSLLRLATICIRAIGSLGISGDDYRGIEPEKPALRHCTECGETVDAIKGKCKCEPSF